MKRKNLLTSLPLASAERLYPLFGLLLMAFNGSVMALEDLKTYPGASCQPSSNTLAILRDSAGRMFNTSTAAQSWTCPIVSESEFDDELENARIVVIDRNVAAGDPNVSCTLHARSSTGVSAGSLTKATVGDTAGAVTLEYGAGNQNAVNAPLGGYYYFQCLIPGTFNGLRSGVVFYRADENVGED